MSDDIGRVARIEEAVDRLRAMVDDRGLTWDLSPNDKQALVVMLDELARVTAERDRARRVIVQAAAALDAARSTFDSRQIDAAAGMVGMSLSAIAETYE